MWRKAEEINYILRELRGHVNFAMIKMVHYNLLFYLFAINIVSDKCNAYRILGIFPINLQSHNNVFESVTKALARHGHQVDVISHFDLKKPVKNYTTIINLDGTLKKASNKWDADRAKKVANTELVKLIVNDCGNNLCDLLSFEKIQKFLQNLPNDPAYDLVITEVFIFSNSNIIFIVFYYFNII